MRETSRMWPGKAAMRSRDEPTAANARRPAERDPARGLFVTAELKVEERGVLAWEQDARRRGARDDNATAQDPESYFVQNVFAEVGQNGTRLSGEGLARLNELRAEARKAVGAHMRCAVQLREAIQARAKRRKELDEIDPRVGRFGEVARISLLTFGFILESVLIWLATYRIDLTGNQRLVAALIVGGLITGVLHVIARYLTQQILRRPPKIALVLIVGVAILITGVVILLLTGLAEVRKTDFAILQGDGVNIASFRGWLFWILLSISILGTLSAVIAGVAHGVESPLRDAEKALRKAKAAEAKHGKEEEAALSRRHAVVDRLDDICDVYCQALDSVSEIGIRVSNEYLAAQGLGHTVEATYRDEKQELEAQATAHADTVRQRRQTIAADLALREAEVALLLQEDGADEAPTDSAVEMVTS